MIVPRPENGPAAGGDKNGVTGLFLVVRLDGSRSSETLWASAALVGGALESGPIAAEPGGAYMAASVRSW